MVLLSTTGEVRVEIVLPCITSHTGGPLKTCTRKHLKKTEHLKKYKRKTKERSRDHLKEYKRPS